MDFLPADYKVKKQKNFPASREEIKKITRKEKALIDANIEVSSDLFAQAVHQQNYQIINKNNVIFTKRRL